jgi:MFS family permease
MRRQKTLALIFVGLLFGVGLSASNTFVAPYGRERDLAFISLYYISYSATAILTRLFGSRFADQIGEERVIPHSLLLVGAGYLILLFAGSSWVLAVSGAVTGCGHGFLFPCINALAIRNEPAEIRGKTTGIATGSIDAGSFAGSIVLGYVADFAGFQVLFLVTTLAFAAGWILWKWRGTKALA